MNVLLPLPVVLPLLCAGMSLALHGRLILQRIVGLGVMTATVITTAVLLFRVDRDGPVAVEVGAWPTPVGITLVADLFSAIMLVVSSVMVLAVLVYAVDSPRTADHALFFHPVYLILGAGVSASFLTGDLFNLFVAFEVMLSASYVFITLGARPDQIRSGMTYVVISLVASTLFITTVGLLDASTGTVNMADLAGKLDAVPDGLRAALGVLLLVVFGIKAAIFPLFFWLPDSYPTALRPPSSPACSPRSVSTRSSERRSCCSRAMADRRLLLAIASATMVVGVLGAVSHNDIKRIMSFHIVSQIGYMIMGLGLFSVAGMAAAIFYIVHHIS